MNSLVRSPSRLVLVLGGTLGLLLVVLAPGWFGGADEGTHFVRSLAMANGQVFPDRVDGRWESEIPLAASESIRLMLMNGAEGTAPNTIGLLGDLLELRPDWSARQAYETGPTLASSPLAYAPSALAMAVPNALGMPPIITLWFGRLGDLIVYIGLVLLALRLASAFRWAIFVTAVLPMNLAMAASLSPDAMTIGSLLIMVALWTRIWNPRLQNDGDDPLLMPLWRVAALVGGVGVMLALSKPPYFIALLAFPALFVVRRSDPRVRVSALAALAATAAGVVAAVLSTSNDYRSAGAGIFAELRFQPEVQLERILTDPLAFLGRCISGWFEILPESVQKWTRQLGIWRSGLPPVVAWAVVVGLIVAVIVLDAQDLLRLRRYCRCIFLLCSAGIVLALMTSSYLYFDDTLEGLHMTDQIGRYAIPLFAVGIMGWAPRWPLRGRLLVMIGGRRWREAMVWLIIGSTVLCVGAVILEWWWPGAATMGSAAGD